MLRKTMTLGNSVILKTLLQIQHDFKIQIGKKNTVKQEWLGMALLINKPGKPLSGCLGE